ncbi:MAG: hypothetical protein VST69_06245 [Nitrospirota bacterium]|nr:hypothetical protein [Nitrospirota bacterium]
MSASEFKLPEGIVLQRGDLADGGYAYTVTDKNLGQLGRILLQGMGDGKTHLSVEIFGDEHDPMIAKRKEILEPIGKKIMSLLREKVSEEMGDNTEFVTIPSVSSEKMETVQLKMDVCEQCAMPSSLLIFAPEAKTATSFENYAAKLRQKYTSDKVPTWIIGAVAKEGPPEGPSCYVLKVWPEKGEIEAMKPNEINPLISVLGRTHCSERE